MPQDGSVCPLSACGAVPGPTLAAAHRAPRGRPRYVRAWSTAAGAAGDAWLGAHEARGRVVSGDTAVRRAGSRRGVTVPGARPPDGAPDSSGAPAETAGRRPWAETLRALREARGVTQEGWAARFGVSRTTVQRWERGARAPDPGAEAALLRYCREAGLLRAFARGPLSGLTLTEDGLRDLFAEARWRGPEGAAGRRAQRPRVPALPGSPAAAPPPNLPEPLTSFVGRERELAALRRVQAGARLLTLTGAGGCGKTRLALALAGELRGAYPHGVWFVDLAPLTDPVLLPQTVADALEARAAGQQPPTAALLEALRARRLLVVLDNCEHQVDACAHLVEALLRACPGLAVVATSREALGVEGETVWRVPPLAVPPPAPGRGAPGPRGPEPAAPDAVRLFVERARLRRPAFAPTAAEAPVVAEICRRLDGLPLAIELAAARVNVLSVDQIAARLDDRFRLLTCAGRTALPRQQTLRTAMDWSYGLLAEPEGALLRALSVFAGGFTLEAAEAVGAGAPVTPPGARCSPLLPLLPAPGRAPAPSPAGATGGADDRADGAPAGPGGEVLDLLARLVDKSLVLAEGHGGETRGAGPPSGLPGGVVRYRLLETVRQYAAERLTAAGEARAARARHAAWCLALAEAAAPHQTGPEQAAWLERLAVEHDNFRTALARCLADARGAAAGLRLGSLLAWLWEVRGHHAEGRRWLTALLARSGAAPPDVRATALNLAGWLTRDQGDYDAAVRLHEESLALWRQLDDAAGVAASLNHLGVVADARGEPARAWALYEESLALRRTLGDRRAVANSLMNLGIAARQRGEPERAAALFEESLAARRALGDSRGVARGLLNLGHVHRDQGSPDRAAARYRASLALYRGLQDRLGAARCLEGLATVAAARGDAGRAARLGGAAAAMREAVGVPPSPAGRAAVDQTVEAARAALGHAAFAAAWAAGRGTPLEQAIEDNPRPSPEAAPSVGPRRGARRARHGTGGPAQPTRAGVGGAGGRVGPQQGGAALQVGGQERHRARREVRGDGHGRLRRQRRPPPRGPSIRGRGEGGRPAGGVQGKRRR
jgi:predicted ATPase/transcriptional regulator with XRE-family HTH domain